MTVQQAFMTVQEGLPSSFCRHFERAMTVMTVMTVLSPKSFKGLPKDSIRPVRGALRR